MYTLINILIFVPVFLLSFDKRVHFYTHFKALFKAIGIVAVPFLVWDYIFTYYGIWGFNTKYLSGLYIANLPLGELLFFITVPYACIFIDACKDAYFPRSIPKKVSLLLFLTYFTLYLILFSQSWGWYPGFNLIAFTFIMGITYFKKKQELLNEFFPSFLLTLIPFLIVNGVLTGSFLESPIVWYNDNENMGLRLGTIPLEDILYSFNLLFSIYALKKHFT